AGSRHGVPAFATEQVAVAVGNVGRHVQAVPRPGPGGEPDRRGTLPVGVERDRGELDVVADDVVVPGTVVPGVLQMAPLERVAVVGEAMCPRELAPARG